MKAMDLVEALGKLDEKQLRSVTVFTRRAPTWRVAMKKTTKFALSAAAVVLVLGFIFTAWWLQSNYGVTPGAAPQKEPLRICLDIGTALDGDLGGSLQESSGRGLLESLDLLALEHKDLEWGDVQLEVIPSTPERADERASMLQRIRTEILSGGGPDVFICATENEGEEYLGGRLFPFVRKAMEEGLFLPLEQLNLALPKELVPQLLEGGRDTGGDQVLIPLSFSVPCLVTRAEFGSEGLDLGMEFSAWFWPRGTFAREDLRKGDHPSSLPYGYSQLEDTENDMLCLTEQELTDLVLNALAQYLMLVAQEPSQRVWSIFPGRSLGSFSDTLALNSPSYAFFPVPNETGGVTAVVSTFCAVNRHTTHPAQAALVMEYLVSEKCQAKSNLFQGLDHFGSASMFVNRQGNLYQPGPLTATSLENWDEVCGKIDSVQYPSPINSLVDDMLREIETVLRESYDHSARLDEFVKGEVNEGDIREIVHRYYGKMEKALGES